MPHLTEEELVLHHYHDDDTPSAAEEHLRGCAECRAQLETIRRVLALVSDAPVPERTASYETEVWNRLRWRLGRGERRRRIGMQSFLAAAAVLALAFFAGQWWQSRRAATSLTPEMTVAHTATTSSAVATASTKPAAVANDRVLLVVVSDHLESSQRMLLEVANADPSRGLELDELQRREDLVASNRMYRQTATQSGQTRIAAVLADLEPVLLELSHAGTKLTADEVTELQKRIDSKGLLFQVRVIGTEAADPDRPPVPLPNSTSL